MFQTVDVIDSLCIFGEKVDVLKVDFLGELTISTRQKAVHISRCLCRQYYANKTKKIANAYCWNGGKTVPRGTLILSREVERKTKGGGGGEREKKGEISDQGNYH